MAGKNVTCLRLASNNFEPRQDNDTVKNLEEQIAFIFAISHLTEADVDEAQTEYHESSRVRRWRNDGKSKVLVSCILLGRIPDCIHH